MSSATPNTPTGGTGQASDPGQQTPAQAATPSAQAATDPTTNATTTNPTAANSGTGQASDQLSAAEAARIIAELRKEAAASRTKLNAYEKAEADRQAASMTELEREQKARTTAEQKLADTERTYQERMIRYEIKLAAQALNIVDPDAAIRLLEWADLEFADDGTPKNVVKLLEKLLEAKPYLKAPSAAPAQPTPQPANRAGAGASNPARSASAPAAQPGRTFDPATRARLGDPNIWPSTRKPQS